MVNNKRPRGRRQGQRSSRGGDFISAEGGSGSACPMRWPSGLAGGGVGRTKDRDGCTPVLVYARMCMCVCACACACAYARAGVDAGCEDESTGPSLTESVYFSCDTDGGGQGGHRGMEREWMRCGHRCCTSQPSAPCSESCPSPPKSPCPAMPPSRTTSAYMCGQWRQRPHGRSSRARCIAPGLCDPSSIVAPPTLSSPPVVSCAVRPVCLFSEPIWALVLPEPTRAHVGSGIGGGQKGAPRWAGVQIGPRYPSSERGKWPLCLSPISATAEGSTPCWGHKRRRCGGCVLRHECCIVGASSDAKQQPQNTLV